MSMRHPRGASPFALGFAVPAFLAAAVFCSSVLLVPLPLPEPTVLLEDRLGGFLCEDAGGEGELGFWPVEADENHLLAAAVIAVEDRRFAFHPGVDAIAIVRALRSTLSGRRQGASTIAMQAVRLAHPGPRTVVRKAREAVAALTAVALYGKAFVLSRYLSAVPQGNRIHGVAYASRRYFRKPVTDLSLAESCILAALPRAPGRMNLFDRDGFELARERALLVLTLLRESGKAEADACAAAAVQLRAMRRPPRDARPEESMHFIVRAIAEARLSGAAGRRVRASIDPELQTFVAGVVRGAVEEHAASFAGNAACVVLSVATGEVLAWAGSSDYFDQSRSGSVDFAAVPRSSGSALKPFLYALGLDEGEFGPSSVLADLPFSVLSATGEYRIGNFDDDYLGPMLYGRALANSRNVPAIRVLEAVGPDRFLQLCRDIGLARGNRDSSWYGYGLAVGGLEVSLSDLAAAYATLARDGRKAELSFFAEEAESPTLSPIKASAGASVLTPAATRRVLLWLSDPQTRAPSFPRLTVLEYPWPVAVKTGTSQGYRDAWTVACSREYVAAFWLGNPGSEPMNRIAGLNAAVYVRAVMERLHPLQKEGIDELLFPPPEGAEAIDVCAISGRRAREGCPSTVREWFAPDEEPRDYCPAHRRVAVDGDTGKPADSRTPVDRVTMTTLVELPREYARWGHARGMDASQSADHPAAGISVVEPKSGSRYLVDPDIPARFQTIPLHAVRSLQGGTLEWFVDGLPFAVAAYPFTARWPLEKGAHVVEARSADGLSRSERVEILVE